MNIKDEYIIISFTGKGGTVVESKASNKHFNDAVRELKRIQTELKNEHTMKKKKKGVRWFFRCLSCAVAETVRDWKRSRRLRKINAATIPPIGLLGDGNAT